jgi:hypothetical protein
MSIISQVIAFQAKIIAFSQEKYFPNFMFVIMSKSAKCLFVLKCIISDEYIKRSLCYEMYKFQQLWEFRVSCSQNSGNILDSRNIEDSLAHFVAIIHICNIQDNIYIK